MTASLSCLRCGEKLQESDGQILSGCGPYCPDSEKHVPVIVVERAA